MSHRLRWPLAVAGGILLAAAVIVLAAFLLRPTSTATLAGVAVECDGIGSGEACEGWAAAVWAAGPRLRTFDPDDVTRLRLIRPFPLPGDCRAEYYIGRDPGEPAAREAVPCPDG